MRSVKCVRLPTEPRARTRYDGPMRVDDYAPRPAVLKWLLESDPAIRWQVMSGLTRESPGAIAGERSRIATEGWGARLLAQQSANGYWGGRRGVSRGTPVKFAETAIGITFYTLVVLKDLGLDPASRQARKMIDRVAKGVKFEPLDNGPFLHGETEP